jgi:hypothetical protein
VALDVTVASPLCKTDIRQTSKTAGAALLLRQAEKQGLHHAPCQARGILFVLVAVETLGGWAVEAVDIIRYISKQFSSRSATPLP